ncbi:carbohydrate-binding family 9-like protein [Paenibacillus aurantius]|uniref:Carbohydrate-binding family 9-like protein n=1 Tax=Paenibacillus aurantius TaxID=2918900 RepID=A0AA96RF14_9BACL|nr:carbohydrate-binding family 9-like protein [Paenibacillus aurantius]WNQ13075.1 carbohydrate-binding family 9-like protein [Paenibacillus aurantius]
MNLGPVPIPRFDPYAPLHYVCRRAQGKPAMNGKLDSPFWEKAPWTSDFVDIEGDLKPKPWKRTRVKMLWDDEYLYVGALMEEDEIWGNVRERDAVIFHDNDFEIFLDPDGDTHLYYELEINALGTVWDLLLPKPYRDGGPPVNGWDIQGLKTAVHIDGELNNPSAVNRGWSVEIALPWKSLKECAAGGRAPVPGDSWRINFSRVEWHVEVKDGKYVKRANPETGRTLPEENWVWSPMGLINMHYPELWGYLWFAGEEGPFDPGRDPDAQTKWELRQLYYLERKYHAEKGAFCSDWEILKGETSWSMEPRIEAGTWFFDISATASDGLSRLHIREDGKLWREGGS